MSPDEISSVADVLTELNRWRVRAARGTGKARLSLQDLSAATGIARSSLSNYLNGTTLIPGDVLDSLVLALGATPQEARQWAEAWERATAAALRSSGPRTVRDQLLPDLGDFVGRAAALDQLDDAGPLVIVTGLAGVGKTSLVLRWAHRSAHRFPDGRFYVNLRGYDLREPMSAGQAAERLLRALDVVDIAEDLEERSAQLRSRLAGQAALIVLDNARSAEQVRPLLPGDKSVRVLVTSRDTLAGLVARDGAQRLPLPPLDDAEARTLLGRLAVDLEQPGTGRVLRWCGGLPLALRLVAERLAAGIHSGLDEVAEQLAERGLGLLSIEDDPQADLRRVFDWSYRTLPDPAARLFRLLGIVPGPDVDAYAAANLLDGDLPQARRQIEALCRAHLLQPVGSGRYQAHDLLKAYAQELSTTDDGRDRAMTALLDWYLDRTAAAMMRVQPHRSPGEGAALPLPEFADRDDAMAWLDAERANLTAAVRLAATEDRPRHAWKLTAALSLYFNLRGHLDDWAACLEDGLSAATLLDDAEARAHIHGAYGSYAYRTGRYELMTEHHAHALEYFRALGDRRGEAAALGNLGIGLFQIGRAAESADRFTEAMEICREQGNRRGESITLTNLASIDDFLGRYELAQRRMRAALDLHREVGEFRLASRTLCNLGQLQLRLGAPGEAAVSLKEARELAERIQDRQLIALSMVFLGRLDGPAGFAMVTEALAIARDNADGATVATALTELGAAHAAEGRHDEARTCREEALQQAYRLADPWLESQIHNDLGETRRALGHDLEADEHFGAAAWIAGRTGARYQLARAWAGLGGGSGPEAEGHRERARGLYRELGVPAPLS